MKDEDVIHFGRIARLLSPPRRKVLEILRDEGPMTVGEIEAAWLDSEPDMRPRAAALVPQMVAQSLWKLANVEFASRTALMVSITDRGQAALRLREGDDLA